MSIDRHSSRRALGIPRRRGFIVRAAILGAFVLGACGHPPTITAGPGASSLAFGHAVSTTVTTVVQRPLQTTWDAVCTGDGIALDEILQPTDKVPGVSRVQLLQGDDWNTEGAHRAVWLTTGDRVEEQITHYRGPNYFAYRTWDLPDPLAERVDHIRGEWWFEPHPEGTRIVWQYTMILSRRSAKPLIAAYLTRHMNPFMQQGMDVIKTEVERMVPVATATPDAPGAR